MIVALALALRLVVAACTGLGVDESYMVAASNHFAWSYFDHPPVSWWLELASRRLFDSQAPLVVRLPFVLLSVVSSWLLYLLTRRLYGARAGFWAVVAYSISPVFSLAFGCWVLPDGPLDAALLAAAYALTRALGIAETPRPPAPSWWAAAGFFAGLALLCKYNAALVLAGAVAVLLTDPSSRPQLRRWWPWAAGLLACLMFTPVIAWNFAHGWQSFHYQSGRATGLRLHPLAPFSIWGGEALFVLPWLWLPMVALLIAALWRGPADRRGWLLAMLGLTPLILFAVIGIWSSTRILYHWAAPGYLLLFPMLGNWVAHWRGKALARIAGASAMLLGGAAMVLAAEISFGFIPGLDRLFAPGRSPLLQLVNWTSIPTQLRNEGEAGLPIAVLRWYDAGKIGYAVGTMSLVTVFGPERHEFGLTTPPSSLIGRDVLLLAMPGDVSAISRTYAPYFKSLEPAPALSVIDHGKVLLVIPVLRGKDLLRAP